jgi:transcriptional regulator of heat shock response
MDLSKRQQSLLKAIINEFIDTAQAVGSLGLSEKYSLDVSPATIRNEMAILNRLGLIDKTHASSGRVPTATALRWFLNESAREEYEHLDSVIAAHIRERLFQRRFNLDKLLSQAVLDLHELTNYLAVAMAGGHQFMAGISSMLDLPEYQDLTRLRSLLGMIEDYQSLLNMLNKHNMSQEVQVIFADETDHYRNTNTAFAFTRVVLHNNQSVYLGVIGPYRMNYARVIPALTYVVSNLEDVSAGWK